MLLPSAKQTWLCCSQGSAWLVGSCLGCLPSHTLQTPTLGVETGFSSLALVWCREGINQTSATARGCACREELKPGQVIWLHLENGFWRSLSACDGPELGASIYLQPLSPCNPQFTGRLLQVLFGEPVGESMTFSLLPPSGSQSFLADKCRIGCTSASAPGCLLGAEGRFLPRKQMCSASSC